MNKQDKILFPESNRFMVVPILQKAVRNLKGNSSSSNFSSENSLIACSISTAFINPTL